MKLRVGIAGDGYIASVHRANLSKDNRVEIAGVYDIDPARATVPSFERLLDLCDAVYITAPNTLHATLALQAVRAGKYVFCEKPMSVTLDGAMKLADAVAGSTKIFQVGHNRRFSKVYSRVKKLLAEHPPHTAHIKMNRGELLKPVWTGDEKVTGGFLFETPIHMLDMMRYQFGEVVSLDARLSRPNDFSMLVEFASGMYATFVTSADASWFFPYERMEVYGEYSTIETGEMETLSYRLSLEAETVTEDFREVPMEERLGFQEEDKLFVDAILTNGAPAVTVFDGLRSVQLALACYESAAKRQRAATAV